MTGPDAILRITTNEGGDRVFQDMDELVVFVKNTASSVTCLLVVVLAAFSSEEGFLEGALKVANDLAFQLEQAVDLLASGVRHD